MSDAVSDAYIFTRYTPMLTTHIRRQEATEAMLAEPVTTRDSSNPSAVAAVIPAVTRPRRNTIAVWKNKYNKVCTYMRIMCCVCCIHLCCVHVYIMCDVCR